MAKKKYEKTIEVTEVDPRLLWGVGHSYFNEIKALNPDLDFHLRGETLTIKGEEELVLKFEQKFTFFLTKVRKQKFVELGELRNIFGELSDINSLQEDAQISSQPVFFDFHGNGIKAKNKSQQDFITSIQKKDIVFSMGPAGTGKTYLAVLMAIKFFKSKMIDRIVITRPVVEAGESLGFLPGDLNEKINPYLRPLFDVLSEILSAEKMKKMLEHDNIEIAPLAYMRGRTLNNCFVVLDEGQNATNSQIKMLLTRLGKNAKCVITGDISQIDLPAKIPSGLVIAQKILQEVRGIQFIEFEKTDIVRHPLVQDIVEAYDSNGY